MGFFSRTPKPSPKITVEGIEIMLDQKLGAWEFTYQGTAFSALEPVFTLPTKAELDTILDTIDSLKQEMKTRIQKELSEWGDLQPDDGELCSVRVDEFGADRTFTVTWLGGDSWGDLGVDFTIKDHAIIDEFWSD